MAKKPDNRSQEFFVQRMRELSNIYKPVNEGLKNSSLIDYLRAANGTAYGIIKENHQYFIKVSNKQGTDLNVTDFAYIGGLENKLRYEHKSLAEANKNRNFYLITINESISTYKPAIREKGVITEEIDGSQKGADANKATGSIPKALAKPAGAIITKDGLQAAQPEEHTQKKADANKATGSMPATPAKPAGAIVTKDGVQAAQPEERSQKKADANKATGSMPKAPAKPADAIVVDEAKNTVQKAQKFVTKSQSKAPEKGVEKKIADVTLTGKATKDALAQTPKASPDVLKEEFPKEEEPTDDAVETPEDGGDEKADIAKAASALSDLDIAADNEKEADSAPVGNEPAADLGAEPSAETPAPIADPAADLGGEPNGDAPADTSDDALGNSPEAGGGAADGGEEIPSGDDAAGLGDEGGDGDADKVDLKKFVGKVQNLASSTDLEDSEIVGQLKQLISGYGDGIAKLDEPEKKDIANKILKPEEGGEDTEGVPSASGEEVPVDAMAEGMSGFKQHVSEMGYDPSDVSKMSVMEMVGCMNSWFNKQQGGDEEADLPTVAEYMNDEIEKELHESGYGDYVEKAMPYKNVEEGGAKEYGSFEPMAGTDEIDDEEGEEGMGAEVGAEMGGESPEAGSEEIPSGDDSIEPVSGEEPMSAAVSSEPSAGMGIAPAADVLSGAGALTATDSAGKKQVSIDLKNDKIDFSINEKTSVDTSGKILIGNIPLNKYIESIVDEKLAEKKNAVDEDKIRKAIKRRIEEKLGLKKPVLSEQYKDSPFLKVVDKYIEDEIKKRSK